MLRNQSSAQPTLIFITPHAHHQQTECQKADWARHRQECKAAQQQRQSGGAGRPFSTAAAAGQQQQQHTLASLMALPVKEIKALLARQGVSAAGAVEKSELAARALEAWR